MARSTNLDGRLARLERAVEGLTPPGVFDVVQAIPVDRAGGLAPGLYPDGPPGSIAGLLVYDPAAGRPRVPEDRLAPWGLVIVSDGATIDTAV